MMSNHSKWQATLKLMTRREGIDGAHNYFDDNRKVFFWTVMMTGNVRILYKVSGGIFYMRIYGNTKNWTAHIEKILPKNSKYRIHELVQW